MKTLTGAAVLVAATLALSACGGSHGAISGGPRLLAATTTLPAPLAKRFAAEAQGMAKSLGDPAVKTAQVYGPDSRYLLVKASSGDLVEKVGRERRGFYLIVLHGHFVCGGCTGPVAGAKPARGKIATEVWSLKTGRTDFGLGNRPVAMSHLRGPTVIMLAAASPTVRTIAAERKRAAMRAAERMLHEFVPPPGARAIQVRPGHYRNAHVLHQSPGEMPSEVVAMHRFWRVRMPLKAVIRFLRAHRLHGFRPTGAMWYTGKPHYLAMGSVWPATENRLPSRFFTVTPVGLPGHTVLRVDAQVVWIYPRPRSEKVPSGVGKIVLRSPNKVFARVTNPAKVARIIRWFNALPISPPGVHIACLLTLHSEITLEFRAQRGALLAQAGVPRTSAGVCQPIGFLIGRHPQRPLIDNPTHASFIERLQRLLGRQLVQNYR
jgi:hypothetical protein